MQSFEEKFQQLNSKINVLKQALDLSGSLQSEDYNKSARNVDREMNSVGKELHLLKIETMREKENLLQLQEIKKQCELFKQHLMYTSSNLPPKLPQLSKPPTVEKTKVEHVEDAPSHVVPCPLTACQYLRFLTTEQFENVPKYMKGRIQYDKVNVVIEKLNNVFVEKYKILKQKKRSLNELNRKRYDAYKTQENKDTRGIYFIVDRDIEDFSTLRMDSSLRNILTMLRHCGLMHEIRGDKCVRYSCYSY